jgi:pimeloyl-ACP methyl ester carboxylesterase
MGPPGALTAAWGLPMLAPMELLGPTSHSFVSQRLRLHYADWGNPGAPLLILQHGGKDHCRSWDWVAAELRHDWHVIAPDLRGHGDSAWSPDADYTMAACVYDFAQLVHTMGQEQVTIIGHSLGGNIAARFAGIFPEKVRRMVNVEGLGFGRRLAAIEASPYPDKMRAWIESRRQAAGRQPRRYATLDDAYARMKAENSFLSDVQARHLTVHGIMRNEDGTFSWKFDNWLNARLPLDIPVEEVRKVWAAIACPSLLIWGKDSFFSSPADDGRLGYFQNATLLEYENAGHWLHHDQFDRFITDVTAFLG